MVPLTVVVACIIAPRFLIRTVADIEQPRSSYESLLAFTAQQPILWTGLALVAGIISALVLFRRFLPSARDTLSRGAESSALPLLNTAAVIGFGGVVRQTAVFNDFARAILDSDLPPLVSATLSVNVMAGIVGSASGGLQIWMSSFAQEYLRAGIDPEVLHRVATVASGGLDSLPHCGGLITMFTVMGVTHRQAYKDFAAVTIVIPVLATAVIVALAFALEL
jgi:H+/gluconate symporter-like permease